MTLKLPHSRKSAVLLERLIAFHHSYHGSTNNVTDAVQIHPAAASKRLADLELSANTRTILGSENITKPIHLTLLTVDDVECLIKPTGIAFESSAIFIRSAETSLTATQRSMGTPATTARC